MAVLSTLMSTTKDKVSTLMCTTSGQVALALVVGGVITTLVYAGHRRSQVPQQVSAVELVRVAQPTLADEEKPVQESKTAQVQKTAQPYTPVSVNYHFSRKCNKKCVSCFHTEKTSHVADEAEMKKGLRLLKQAGMKKMNFAGGEPFLYPKDLAMLVRYCKEYLKLESVSIISNGTLIKKKWLEEHGKYIDVLGVSCDSFDEHTNDLIGRGTGKNVETLFEIRDWCRELGIKFKLNTVVLSLSWQEDMAATVEQLDPFRWKVFQVLGVEGENDSPKEETRSNEHKRNVHQYLISKEKFDTFCEKHKHLKCFVPESNDIMASSYLILDEYLRFLDKGNGAETATASILDVGVAKALLQVNWDEEAFEKRGGQYEWSKNFEQGGAGGDGGCGKELPKKYKF